MKKKITLREIASIAKVSPATASIVLNDKKNQGISDKTWNKVKKIAQKFGEESAELIIDYLKGTKKRTIEEATDLIYHLFVLLSSKKISYQDIQKELTKRHNVRRK